jgi:hypothetical protein
MSSQVPCEALLGRSLAIAVASVRIPTPGDDVVFWVAPRPSSRGGGFSSLGENFAGPRTLPTTTTHSCAIHLLGGVVARPSSFGSSSSARLPARHRVPPWAAVFEQWRSLGVDMVVPSPVQQKTRLPHLGSCWHFGLPFFCVCCLLLRVRCALCAGVRCNCWL